MSLCCFQKTVATKVTQWYGGGCWIYCNVAAVCLIPVPVQSNPNGALNCPEANSLPGASPLALPAD